MELREYLSVRRAYNLVRQDLLSFERITFEEFAILCRLSFSEAPVRTCDIADYQGALRPTMTHRTNHLASLGLIDRVEGEKDRRNIVCSLTDAGRRVADGFAYLVSTYLNVVELIPPITPLHVKRRVDVMGSVYCASGSLVLLALVQVAPAGLTVTQIFERLGLLQPTVSMSVSALEGRDLVWRDAAAADSKHAGHIKLTDQGMQVARDLAAQIQLMPVSANTGAEEA